MINESEEQIAEVIVQANQERVVKGMTALTPETIRNISGANAECGKSADKSAWCQFK